MKNYIVYKHTCPNRKIYIGITSQNPIDRWNRGHGYSANKFFWNDIVKYGWDNIKHEIVYSNLTKEEAEQKEIELIAKFKSNTINYGYNVKSGGHCGGSMPVCQYTKSGNIVNTYANASEAANKTGIAIDSIRRCCAKNRRKTYDKRAYRAHGFEFWYENDRIKYIKKFIGH